VKENDKMNRIADFKEERGFIFQQLNAGELSVFEAGQLLDSLYLKYEEIFPDAPEPIEESTSNSNN
jgi:hypothetical protein